MKTLTKKIFFIGYFSSILFLGSILCSIATPNQTNFSSNYNNINTQENVEPSQFAEREIRVAIYNEPNTTLPSYAQGTTSGLTNKYSGLMSILLAAGYHVSELTVVDISAHKLKTANYDIFIMVDNLPRENITNFVKEFWLGGGGVLSLDSAICFICYAGMIPPESVGSHGYGTYWSYDYSNTFNITFRNPVTKAYQVNDSIYESIKGWASFRWNVLQSTSIASEIVKLATIKNQPNYVPVIGLDPINKGGRIVQIPCIGEVIDSSMEDLIEDAVDWLCPHPKGRVLFDLSHKPECGFDPWDSIYVEADTIFYSLLRDNLINRSYTFDKLYPSSFGNLTTANLAKYDLLIELQTEINFTSSEISVISDWVNMGGALLAIGDQFFLDSSKNINYLLSNYDLAIISGTGGSNTINYRCEHPTIENCVILEAWSPGFIDCSGDAYPIWGNDATRIIIAGQEYGNGRIILMADTAIFRNNFMNLEDNLQYSINIVNWLTACHAEVLVYIDDGPNENPNENPYKGPVVTALNDLSIKFYLTFNSSTYFKLNLATKDWTLVVIDTNYISVVLSNGDDILNYVKNGGKLIIRESYMNHPSIILSPLWQYLGFTPNGTTKSSPPIINIWNNDHPIFKTPANYAANNLTTSLNLFEVDFCFVELHSNATAIAGLGTTPHNEKGAIILSKNNRVITNTMALTEYYDDTDDSTYPDALEIWENEIAFLMPSSIGPSVLSGGDDDDDDENYTGSIPFGNYYLLFTLIAAISLILIYKRKIILSKN